MNQFGPAHRYRARLLGAAVAIALLTVSVAGAFAADAAPAAVQTEHRDPWVPPEARKPATSPPTEGGELRAQVERKLKRGFDAADVRGTGMLTREEAAAGGLGYIVKHFDQIDRGGSGVVRFEDVKRFLREQGAQLN